jgi:RNA ligase
MLDELQPLVEAKYIDKRPHPSLPYDIYNYTFKCEIERYWNDYTKMCRGLILDRTGKIVGRPFGKFFNMDDHLIKDEIPWELPFEVREKWDGSLGILCISEHGPLFATRGSFASEQAIKGYEILQRRYGTDWARDDTTYLFEIIYPANRIVVDYGQLEDLVLIGLIETHTGREPCALESAFEWTGMIAEKYDRPLDALLPEFKNDEGVVVRFSNGFRMKVKQEEYKRLHRIITNITEYDIWEMLQFNEEMFGSLPDDIVEWANGVRSRLEFEFDGLVQSVEYWYTIVYYEDPKQFAANVNSEGYSLHQWVKTCLFMKYNGRDYTPHIWKQIKPAKVGPFKIERLSNGSES